MIQHSTLTPKFKEMKFDINKDMMREKLDGKEDSLNCQEIEDEIDQLLCSQPPNENQSSNVPQQVGRYLSEIAELKTQLEILNINLNQANEKLKQKEYIIQEQNTLISELKGRKEDRIMNVMSSPSTLIQDQLLSSFVQEEFKLGCDGKEFNPTDSELYDII